MWLEAILTKEDLQKVVRQFSPLKLLLGDSGTILLASPCEVSLIPGEGIGVVCDATLHWPVLGIDVPVELRSLTLRILPAVLEAQEDGTRPLVFRLQIDHTGVAMLPSMIDHRVTAMVNEELEKKHVELSWNFLETLSEVFHLPASLVSSGALALRATDGKVKATETALGFAVRYETTVLPRADVVSAPASPPSASEAPPAPMASEPPSGSLRPYGASSTEARAFVFGGAVGALAFMTLGAFARMVRRRR
jgi:hypothetical protein